MIAYVGPDSHPVQDKGTQVIDAEGMVLLPGLIDGHTHIISRTNIEEFVRYVIPGGTTTVITETIELATIVGKDGIDYFVKGLEGQPIRFFYTDSSSVRSDIGRGDPGPCQRGTPSPVKGPEVSRGG